MHDESEKEETCFAINSLDLSKVECSAFIVALWNTDWRRRRKKMNQSRIINDNMANVRQNSHIIMIGRSIKSVGLKSNSWNPLNYTQKVKTCVKPKYIDERWCIITSYWKTKVLYFVCLVWHGCIVAMSSRLFRLCVNGRS